ncbi:hypothetical protein C8C83_0524 [Flavobacterium sp. 90]|uniref:hypothetical protein n=1 Tax=unclassified Flavobacterium TaxID=196869 RepID=UPI000EACB2B9|nr:MULTISPECIES: hypothetical protein [unclassified Flavobacterium]RKR08928.1 hypothetical protein C8C82_0819 [Flavobacterium sp. 81]TCK52716.1 hypothetical protein C8C83_0524 [Flavobacterium sp. 90]
MEKVFFTRLELYNLVWKFSIAQIKKDYGISSMGIKNACHKLKIPLPNSNYWLKPNYKRSNVPELSEYNSENDPIGILKKTYEIQLRSTSKTTPLLDLIKSIESDPNAPLAVPNKLTKPCKLILNTKTYWSNKQNPSNPSKNFSKVLDINVTPQNIPRALLFMDAFIKLLQYRGHKFEKSSNKTGTIFMKNGIAIDIYLREALKRITPEVFQDSAQYVHTNEFILQITRHSYKKEWRDGKISLENSLARIVAKLEMIAGEEK